MPFTFSHPAVILPLIAKRSKYFSATGLVIGSIAPDFESFIKFGGPKVYSHTWAGVFWFDMPLALALAFLFHLVIKRPVIDNLPFPLRSRLGAFKSYKWVSYFLDNTIVVLVSLFIGIVSHLFWDAFTHLNLYYPDDATSKILLLHHRLYILLQYACSVVGLVAIMAFIYYLPETKVPKTKIEKGKYWIYMSLIAVLIICYIVTSLPEDDKVDYMDVISISLSALFYSMIIMSLVKVIFVYNYRKIRKK